MKSKTFFLILITAFVLIVSADAFAQGRGWGRWAQADHRYDATTVETVQGIVEDVAYVTPTQGQGQGPGIHFTLKKDNDMLEILLGPVSYLNEQAEPFEKGDAVTVVGSRITLDGKPALIAKTLTFGDKIIALRDDAGFPKWRGTQRNQGHTMGMGRGMGRGQGPGAGGCQCCAGS